MLNFLYCFDSNYNIQTIVSIYSLLKSVSEKINIFIIHQSEETPEFLPKKILESENLNNIHVYKFNKSDFKFYNLIDAHVTEATFYRLFLLKYIPENIKNIIYLDGDVYCISNPLEQIKKEFQNLKSSGLEAGFSVETNRNDINQTSFKRLKLKGDSYFNAGVMLMDVEKARKNNFSKKVFDILSQIKEDAIFWDQDILNKYYDDKFLKITENLNYKVNYFEKNYTEILEQNNISFVHYSGKFKPWHVRGVAHSSSFIFQDMFNEVYDKKYYISNSRKIIAIKDFFKILINLKLEFIKSPFFFLIGIFRFLLNKNKNI